MKKGPDAKRWRPGGDNSGARPRLRTAKTLEMTMSTPNVYALTATVGIRIAQYCLDYTGPGGYYTPSMLLGSRFIESIPGIEVHCAQSKINERFSQRFFLFVAVSFNCFSAPPSGARTLNPNIESVVSTSRTKTKFLSVTD